MKSKSLFLSLLYLCLGTALPSTARQVDSPSPELNLIVSSVKKIHTQMLHSRPCHPPALTCFGSSPELLKKLLRDYTTSALNRTNGDLNSLIADLRQIDDAEFSAEMDKSGLGLRRDWNIDPPFAIRRELPIGELVITLNRFSVGALAIPSDLVIIQAFRKEGGVYVYADQTGDDLFGITDYKKFEIVGSPETNHIWLLAQGQIAGYMGDLERARLYSFDGYRFIEEWKPEDRPNMRIKVSANQVDARYISKNIGGFAQPDTEDCMEEKLQVGAGELLQLGIVNHGECENFETVQ